MGATSEGGRGVLRRGQHRGQDGGHRSHGQVLRGHEGDRGADPQGHEREREVSGRHGRASAADGRPRHDQGWLGGLRSKGGRSHVVAWSAGGREDVPQAGHRCLPRLRRLQEHALPPGTRTAHPSEQGVANEVLFDEEGQYADFDRSNPTAASGGKPKVLNMMKRKHGYKTMIMFGDGATDMDARTQGPAAAFVGYGGVTVRPNIKAGADWFITDFQEILDVLPKGHEL